MNRKINDTLDWFQNRIGSFDKQLWESKFEQSLETKSFQNHQSFYCITKKSNKVQDFIDIDLIKGSTFSKAKSNKNLLIVIIYGILRLLLFPFYFQWWYFQLGKRLTILLFIVYFVQFINFIIYYMYYYANSNDSENGKTKQEAISFTEICTPEIIMFILGIMYTYIASTLPGTTDYDKSDNETVLQAEINEYTQGKLNKKAFTTELDCSSDESTDQECSILNADISIDTAAAATPPTATTMASNDASNGSTSTGSSIRKRKPMNSSHSCANFNLYDNSSDAKREKPDTKKYFRYQSINLSAVRHKISCIVWHGNEWKGADLSMLEISTIIISNVRNAYLGLDYFYVGTIFSIGITLLPFYYRHSFNETCYANKVNCTLNGSTTTTTIATLSTLFTDLYFLNYNNSFIEYLKTILNFCLKNSKLTWFLLVNIAFSTCILCILFFSLLSIAERTLNQRLLHAKYFCYLTSNRKARKHNLPHFRLSSVENIKTWLSMRSYMKKRGPQRSINAIISSTFLISVTLCSIVCIQFLRDSDFLTNSLLNWQLVFWCLCIWTFMLRLMSVGFKINKKYRNCMSIVIMEQINSYLQIEKLSEKKDELTIVNNVLKLAADLLKEIEKPFRISGLIVNPWIYNITKVVILSAFSAVLSELFGFKLKLYKIKIG